MPYYIVYNNNPCSITITIMETTVLGRIGIFIIRVKIKQHLLYKIEDSFNLVFILCAYNYLIQQLYTKYYVKHRQFCMLSLTLLCVTLQ